MNKKKSLKKNAVLNSVRNILRLIFPLITIPYVSRILGVEKVGEYSFSYSIISYFILLSKLGIETFAVREGAKYRENKKKFSIFASEVFTINILSTLLSYILLIICLLVVPQIGEYKLLIEILSLEILLTTLGCEWIYIIYEDYTYITTRSIVFQIISVILLLSFIKNPNDLVIYTIIMVVSSTGSNLLNLFNIHKYCKLKFKITNNTKKYMIPILILFANTVATTIYSDSDITILGLLSDNYHVGIYSIATKIYTTIKMILSSIIVVSIPRLSYLLGNNDICEFENTGKRIINVLTYCVLPAMVGIICIAYQIIFIVAGKNYVEGKIALQILGVALMFSLYSWFYTSCILIPAKREKDVLMTTAIAGFTNIFLNFVLIPYFIQNATAFTTLLAEFISFIICYIKSKEIVKIKIEIRNFSSTFIGCIGIFIFCFIVNKYLILNVILNTLICVIGSILVYIIITMLMKNEVLFTLVDILKDKFIGVKKNKA